VSGGAGGFATVLVVAADRASREGLRAMLEADGHTAESAADVWHAVARIRERRFDVVVADLDLPPVHGIRLGASDLIRMLLASRPSHTLVVVSAEDRVWCPPEARPPRIAAVLEKPICPVELRAVVRAGGKREAAPERQP
jgi:DNA-binding NtrC family response regulator